MESIWLGLCPSPRTTRVLAMRGPGETIMKAHLSLRPSSPRAVIALLEALTLWEGLPVRAALVVDDGCFALLVRRSRSAVHGTRVRRGLNRATVPRPLASCVPSRERAATRLARHKR
jgi:hypothetical protein